MESISSTTSQFFDEQNERVENREIKMESGTSITHIRALDTSSIFFKEGIDVKPKPKVLMVEQKVMIAANAQVKSPEGKARESPRLREKAQKISYSEEYYDEVIEDPEEMEKDEEAAISSDLPPDEMSVLEQTELPQFASHPDLYIQIRNHILRLWQDDLSNYLTIKKAAKDIQEKYNAFVPPIFRFLVRFGYINTGIISGPNTERVASKKSVIVIGCGMAGLAAARQLHSMGYNVTAIEARDRVGGRVNTDTTLGPIDLGASIVTGLEGNPLTIVCKQLHTQLHPLTFECPIYDCDGQPIDDQTDQRVEKEFNELLETSSKLKESLPHSLGDALKTLIDQRNLSEKELRLLHWHIANLEYGCASDLREVSLGQWDQDDGYEWAGDHCLLREGYSSIAKQLAGGLDIKYNTVVTEICYDSPVPYVNTEDGNKYEADYIIVTLPLGILKERAVQFRPELPEWKTSAIDKLGYGLLNKVVLSFPYVFWDDRLDYFGQVAEDIEYRGEFYLFWNLHRCMGKPVLVSLLAGKAAYNAEKFPDDVIISKIMKCLRQRFGESTPDPVNHIITKWRSDKFARGTYSYVAVGSTGDDYDTMKKPVGDRLFFAGEATTREHPATAAGAYQSGLMVAGMLDTVCRGKIDVDIDVAKLTAEWKKETSYSSREKKRNRNRDRYREDEMYQRAKRGHKLRKAVINESYAWLFNSEYRIPKKRRTDSPPKQRHELTAIKSNNNNHASPMLGELAPTNRRLQHDLKLRQSLITLTEKQQYLQYYQKQQQQQSKQQEQPQSQQPFHPYQQKQNRHSNVDQSVTVIERPRVSFISNYPTQQHSQPYQVRQMPTSSSVQQKYQSYSHPEMVHMVLVPSQSRPPQPQQQYPQQPSYAKPNPVNLSYPPVNDASKPVNHEKEKVSEKVCGYLNKYMNDGRIKNREDFKKLARKLTHLLLQQQQGESEKNAASDAIVRCLNPYTNSERISSKEDFKHLARKITHLILGSSLSSPPISASSSSHAL